VVDAEFGMLLRLVAVLDRQPFIMSEVTDVSFGPSPDALFIGPADASLLPVPDQSWTRRMTREHIRDPGSQNQGFGGPTDG
jgi:hypothetical protein